MKYLKHILCSLAAICISAGMTGQIWPEEGEYFFDTDPGVGAGTFFSITDDGSDTQSLDIPIDALESGLHLLYMRVKDDNTNYWSLSRPMLFNIIDTAAVELIESELGKIYAAEYFIDTDPGVGNGIAIDGITPSESFAHVFTFSSDTLSDGFHTVYLRVLDFEGNWSIAGEYDIEITAAPACVFPVPAFAADTVSFGVATTFLDLSSLVDPGATYAWDAGADGSIEGTSNAFSFTFASPGYHSVALTIENEDATCTATHIGVVSVGIFPDPSISNSGSDNLCTGESTMLTAEAGHSYIWNTGETTQSISVSTPGDYHCKLLSADSLCTFSDTVSITLTETPELLSELSNETNGLSNGSITLLPATPGELPGVYEYAWNTGSSSNYIDNLSAGMYSVTVTRDGLCPVVLDFDVQNVVVSSGIQAAEYYMDTDPGVGNGTPIAISQGDPVFTSFDIPIVGLDPGNHCLYTRVKGYDNMWSITGCYQFSVYDILPPDPQTSADIVAVEYFIDEDPGVGMGTASSFDALDPYSGNQDIDVSGLTPGQHTLYFRTKDADGNWAQAYDMLFSVYETVTLPEDPELDILTAAEYFIDTDPGVGAATPVPGFVSGDSFTGSFLPEISGLAEGNHMVYVRVRDQLGNWSIAGQQALEIIPDPPCQQPVASFDFNENAAINTAEIFTNTSTNVAGTATYAWDIGVDGVIEGTGEDFSHTFTGTGFYQVSLTVTNSPECTSTFIANISVGELAGGTLIASGPLAFCEGETVQLNAPAAASYFWSTGETTPFIITGEPGNYYCFITNADGLSAFTDTATVETFEVPAFDFTVVDESNGNANGSVIANPVGLNLVSDFDYAWSTGSSDYFIDNLSAGNYSLTATNGACISNFDFTLTNSVVSEGVVQAEYFFDSDPGIGNGVAMNIAEGDMIAAIEEISVTGLVAGNHTLYVRVQEDLGNWSVAYDLPFSVYDTSPPPPPPVSADLASGEYFFDNDPGVGNGTAVPAGYPDAMVDGSLEVATDALAPGIHNLYFRFLDEAGQWSISRGYEFEIDPSLSLQAFATIEGLFYEEQQLTDFNILEESLGTSLALRLKNSGTVDLDSVNINYTINGGPVEVYPWMGTVIPEDTFTVDMPITPQIENYYDLVLWTSENNGEMGLEGLNDTLRTTFMLNPSDLHNAVELLGSTDFVEISDADTLDIGTNKITMEAWVYATAGGDAYNRLITKQVENNAAPYMAYGINEFSTTNRLTSIVSFEGGGSSVLTTDNALPQEKWTHVAAVYDGDALTFDMYFNGELQSVSYGSPVVNGIIRNTTTPLVFGADLEINSDGSAENYNGKLDEVRIWNVARSQSEIQEWMPKVSGVEAESGLVGVWHFSELAGNIAFEPNGLDGTLFNGASFGLSEAPILDAEPVDFIDFSFDALEVNGDPDPFIIIDEGVDQPVDVLFTNLSNIPLTTADFDWSLTGQSGSVEWNGGLNPGESETFLADLPIETLPMGVLDTLTVDLTTLNDSSITAMALASSSASAVIAINPADPHFAVNFDSESRWIEATAPGLPQGTDAVTIEAWVNPVDLDATIASWGPGGNYRFQLNNGRLLQTLYIVGGSTDHFEEGQGVVAANEWSHVAASFDGDSVRFYINGNLDHTGYLTSGAAPDVYDILNIGRMLNVTNSESFFNGQIDELRIWSEARSQAQIREWMTKNESIELESGLVNLWHFEEGAGLLTFERTNGIPGVFQNSPAFSISGAPIADPELIPYVDAQVESISIDFGVTDGLIIGNEADNPVSPSVNISNQGNVALSSVYVDVFQDDVNVFSGNQTFPPILPGGTQTFNLAASVSFLPETTYDLTAVISNPNGIIDPNESNNSITQTAVVNPATTHYGISMDGSGDYVDLPDAELAGALDADDSFTIEGWVETNSPSRQEFVVGVNTSGGGNVVLIGFNDNPSIFEVYDGPTSTAYEVLPRSEMLGWHHFAYVRNGATADMYVDGEYVMSHNPTYTLGATNKWSLGMELDGGSATDYLLGNVDEFRVWNEARSAEQIREWMSKTTNVDSETGLVALWRFGEGSGSAYDAVNNWEAPMVGQAAHYFTDAPVPDAPPAFDLAITAVIDPVSGCDKTNEEEITLRVRNFGTNDITGFDLGFIQNDGLPSVETVGNTILSGTYEDITLTGTANLVVLSENTLDCFVSLLGDENGNNDTLSVTVTSLPSIVPEIPEDVTIDYGDSVDLTAGGGTNYTWSGDLEGQSPYNPTITVAPFEDQTYTVTITNDSGCSYTDSVHVFVNPIPALPDYEVNNVSTGLTDIEPGELVTLNWDVNNVGTANGSGNWTEKIYIESTTGANRTILSTAPYTGDSVLVAGTRMRSTMITLPEIVSIGDSGVFVVEILPDDLEPPLSEDNNTGIEAGGWLILRELSLEVASLQIEEGGAGLYCTVFRSGGTSGALPVTVSLSEPARFSFPATVTIANGQNGKSFYVYALDNADLEGPLAINFDVSATGLDPDHTILTLIDDEIPSLSITGLAPSLMEGETLNFTVNTDFPPAEDLSVSILSSEPGDVPLPTPVIIPAGMTSVPVSVVLPDDDIAEPDEGITITAGSAGLNSGFGYFTLTNDSDIPAISFELTIDTISESAGLFATQGIISRTTDVDAILQVDISSDDPASLYMPSTVPLGPGEMEKSFYIGIFDNLQVDGTRNIEITASVLLSTCGCAASASSAGVVSDILTVNDNDGPTISLFVNPLSMQEDEANAGTLTVERNTPTDVALDVNLSVDDLTEVSLPAVVTIPIGQASINVPITTLPDVLEDGNQQVTITADADGFSQGVIWVYVTDINKPDWVIADVTVPQDTVAALEPFEFHAFITNQGVASAPSGMNLKAYLSTNFFLDDSDIEIGSYILDQSLAVGDTVDFWDLANAPYQPGDYQLIVEVNSDENFDELVFINNTSLPVDFVVLPDYSGTATVDDTQFNQGETVPIYGSAIRSNGDPQPNAELEVYVLNSGYRREISVTTDSLGEYTTNFIPLPYEADHYEVGASFPNLNATEVQDEFDIMGAKLNNNSYVLWEFLLGDTIFGSLPVENLSDVPLNNLIITPENLPDGAELWIDTIPFLDGNATAAFHYWITGSQVSIPGSYMEFNLNLTSDENVDQDLDGFYFCQALQGALAASITSIDRTISQDQSNFLEFEVYNVGLGETGEITFDIPPVDFMDLVTLEVLPSLGSGDTTLVIMEFIPAESLPLNTPASGNFVIDSENGNFLNIPFTVEKVSDNVGSVVVDVIDQFTYFTEEAPHVDSAYVKISHYFTGEVFAEGLTNEDGLFMADSLPEGVLRLQVQALQHAGYDNVINILPGAEITETVFLEYQAVSFTWNVEETTIEDTYLIELIMEFETNVPVPVVTIEMPDVMPELFGDEEFNFLVTLTNEGLITAQDVELHLPEDNATYEFITDYVPIDMPAQYAIQVPVTMRLRDEAPIAPGIVTIGDASEQLDMDQDDYEQFASIATGCTDFAFTVYFYECGDNGLWQQGAEAFTYEGQICSGGTGEISIDGWPPGGGGGGGSGPGGCPGCGTGEPGGGGGEIPEITSAASCNPCLLSILSAAGGCLGGPAAVAGCIASIATSGGGWGTAAAVAGCIPGPIGCTVGVGSAIYTCISQYGGGSSLTSDLLPPIVAQAGEDLEQVQIAWEAHEAWMFEYFGPIAGNENIGEFAFYVADYMDNNLPIGPTDADAIKLELAGFDISEAEIDAFLLRWNTTVEAWGLGIYAPNATYPDIVNRPQLESYIMQIEEVQTYAEGRGYLFIEEMEEDAINTILTQGQEESDGVCTSVGISISQELTLTREAFEGTLVLDNGHPSVALDSIWLDLQILNPSGVLSNDLFEIQVTQLNTLTEIDGTGTLAADTEGSAIILFIPETAAAPTVPVTYSFGGNLSYRDPYTGLVVTYPLIPSVLQVNPSPDLYLHYFMQRDIYGDDPLTPSIEPILPGELAVMVENNGYGPALGVTIESGQPEIVDNDDGLAIDFSLIGSNLQGEPAALGLTFIDFGQIQPFTTKVGQWYFTSTLLGHFISYETNLVHLDSYGNPDLSLVSGAELHELIKSIEVYTQDDGVHDFLVNEIQDPEERPDAIYLSQGNLIYEVHEPEAAYMDGNILAPGNQTTLHVDPLAQGWQYLKIDDPGQGNFEIVSVVRDSDGLVLPLMNAWLRHVTLPDSQEPIYEDTFHFVDEILSFDEETYTITWSPKDPNPPFVESITGAPLGVSADQVTNLTVTFSEEIIESSFGTEDLMLTYQGGSDIIDETVIITMLDSVTYDVDISSLTTGSGFYNFIAQAAGVQDVTATFGEVGEQATWTQFLNVPVVQEFQGIPESYISNSYDAITVLFNMPMDVTTVIEDNFRIMYDGLEQVGPLTVTQLNVEKTLFEISGLAPLFAVDGDYEFVVDLLSMTSDGGIVGLTEQTIDLTYDTQAPTAINLLPFLGGGLDGQHYTGVTVNFDEDISGLDTTAIQLLRDGMPIYWAEMMAEVDAVNPSWFNIESFGDQTYPDGDYTFRVMLDQVTDLAGNPGSGTEEVDWTVNRIPTLILSSLSVAPDLGFSLTDGITSTTDLTFGFSISEPAAQATVYQDDNGTLTEIETLYDLDAGLSLVPLLLATGGNTAVLVEVIDLFGNEVSGTLDLFIDEASLSATWDLEPGQELESHPDALGITFSDQLLDPSEVQNALSATFDNNQIDLSGISVNFTSDTTFVVDGLNTIDSVAGTYEFVLDLTVLNKYSSGITGSGSESVSWMITDEENFAPIADAGSDTLLTESILYELDGTASFDYNEGDLLFFTWFAPEGVLLNNANSATPELNASSSINGVQTFLLQVSDGVSYSTDIVQITVDIPEISCEADLNDDGYVNTNDLLLLLGNWSCMLPSVCPGDVNGDGITSTADIVELLGNWNTVCAD